MHKIWRVVTLLALAIVITGCSQEYRENPEAIAQAIAHGKREAALEYLNREVAIYSACAWMINLCPKTITAKGRLSLEEGVASGGSSLLFWIIALGKFLMIAAVLGAFLASINLVWKRGMLCCITPKKLRS